MKIDNKRLGGCVIEAKQSEIDGVPVGTISGYIATWDLDRGDWFYKDQFVKGCFAESIKEFQAQKRMPRFKNQHDRTIGGWKYESLKEDDRGLFGEAEVNLDVQQGREIYSMAKQGVLTDFSIGFMADKFSIDEINKIRTIQKATIFEGSIVDEPMNPKANVTSVKGSTTFQDLPLADVSKPWSATEARGRVRQLLDSVEEPSSRYRRAFFWFDSEDAENFGAYKLPFADVVDGELVAVPRAIFAAAAAMRGARGGVDIPDSDRGAVESHINRYYSKMDRESPLKEKALVVDAIDVKYLTKREFEDILSLEGVKFSTQASKALISCLNVEALRDAGGNDARDAKSDSDEAEAKMDELINLLEKK